MELVLLAFIALVAAVCAMAWLGTPAKPPPPPADNRVQCPRCKNIAVSGMAALGIAQYAVDVCLNRWADDITALTQGR